MAESPLEQAKKQITRMLPGMTVDDARNQLEAAVGSYALDGANCVGICNLDTSRVNVAIQSGTISEVLSFG